MFPICKNGLCATPRWMRHVLLAAGTYHLIFAVWANCWPHLWFDWLALERPNHPIIWRSIGGIMGLLGLILIVAARDPVRSWSVSLIALTKFLFGTLLFAVAYYQQQIPLHSLWMMLVNDLVWVIPFSMILWASVRAFTGVPPSRSEPYTIAEAAENYTLSTGKTLAAASESQLLVLVFLRHFGCTFTRQILRGLEHIQQEAHTHGAELVLVHMLQDGKESRYLTQSNTVTRIADPRCELYRAFGLGKGGFFELFGPAVWWRGLLSVFKGCGVGHLAGDGLQMPGAFLFHHGEILASQRAHSASDLPDLPKLFHDHH